MERILLVVDGSPQARRAVSVVVELTLRTGASVLVIPQPGPGDDNNKAGWTADSVARYAVDRLVSAGVDAGTDGSRAVRRIWTARGSQLVRSGFRGCAG